MFKNFGAPLDGRLVDLRQVPDEVFAGKIMGDGFAIDPVNGEVVSPLNGTVTSFMADTRHAVGITSDEGLEVLIHIGINTVKLAGDGFVGLVGQNEKVSAGRALVEGELATSRAKVPPLVSPIVFTNLPAGRAVYVQAGRTIRRGEQGFFDIR